MIEFMSSTNMMSNVQPFTWVGEHLVPDGTGLHAMTRFVPAFAGIVQELMSRVKVHRNLSRDDSLARCMGELIVLMTKAYRK